MSLYTEFEEAVQELDALTSEGFFGENVKQLMLQREHNDMYEHLYRCFLDWAEDERQYGKENVAHLIFLILRLYVDAWDGKNQEAIDIITSIWKGTSEHPHLECTSAYTEYLRTHVEFIKLISELGAKPKASIAERKKLAAALTGAYTKGVEFLSKVLTRMLTLMQLIHGEPHDMLKNAEMTLAKKIQAFLSLSQGKYDVLVSKLDRDIRNAEAHLSIFYSINENVYVVRKTVGKGKKCMTRKIPAKTMIEEIYPIVGWLSQAYVYSAIMLVLAHENSNRFTESMKKVQIIGRSIALPQQGVTP